MWRGGNASASGAAPQAGKAAHIARTDGARPAGGPKARRTRPTPPGDNGPLAEPTGMPRSGANGPNVRTGHGGEKRTFPFHRCSMHRRIETGPLANHTMSEGVYENIPLFSDWRPQKPDRGGAVVITP